MSYIDKLPEKIRGKRCMALDNDGDRCKKRATIGQTYHGNPEHIGYDTCSWVIVYLCPEHMS